jgi:hypothetical protein
VGLEGAKLVTSEDTLRRMGRGGQHFLAGSVADAEVSNTPSWRRSWTNFSLL